MGWQDDLLPDTVTIDVDGKSTPGADLRAIPFIKDTPDFPTFVKRSLDAHREIGSRIPLKVDPTKADEVANWRKEHLPKLYKAGILDTPVADPKEYNITRPAAIPDGLGWNDELATEMGTVLQKHGIPKSAVPELLALHEKSLLGAQTVLKTSIEEGMAALRKEHGDKLDERMEVAKRFIPLIFKTPEELEFAEKIGIANHPGFLSVMLRLAPLAMQDSSLIDSLKREGGGLTGEDVRKELADIMSNTENPKHKLFMSQDKATMAYVDDLYRKAHGTGVVEVSAGIIAQTRE